MSEDTLLYAEAILGKDAEEWLNTDLGRYVVGRIEQDEQEALEALATVLPWRRRKMQELQNRVWRARQLKGYLTELLVTGRQALSQLENSES